MNLMKSLEEQSDKTAKARKEVVSVLIGKAWVKDGKGFSISPLTEPVPGEKGSYQISGVYPLILTDYTTIGLGINSKCDTAKNQATHWVFLNVEKDRLDEYKGLLAKIGQELGTGKEQK